MNRVERSGNPRMALAMVVIAAAFAPACAGSVYEPNHEVQPYVHEHEHSEESYGEHEDHDEHDEHEAHESAMSAEENARINPPGTHVLVLETTHLDRPAEVVGVMDVHAEMGGQEAALSALRARAAALGADAVVGVEFHHGHSHGEPTHLSGLAVRFVTLPADPGR